MELRVLARTRTPLRIGRVRMATARAAGAIERRARTWFADLGELWLPRTVRAVVADVALLTIPVVASVVLVVSWLALVNGNGLPSSHIAG